MSIILGIDPGTTTTGFAIIKKEGNRRHILNFGVIETAPKQDLGIKLMQIEEDIAGLIEEYSPQVCAIEKLFFTNNQKTGIDVAHSRGVMINLLTKKGIHILEYTPLQVKRGICGNGSAEKKQVQNALKFLFQLDEIPKPDDAADALAIAYIGSLQKIGL